MAHTHSATAPRQRQRGRVVLRRDAVSQPGPDAAACGGAGVREGSCRRLSAVPGTTQAVLFQGRGADVQPSDVASRGLAEQAAVLAAELGRTVISHCITGRRGIGHLTQHEATGFLRPELLLVFQRAPGGDGLERVVQPGRAHAHGAGHLLDPERLGVVQPKPLDRMCDALCLAAGDRDLVQLARAARPEETIQDLSLDHGRQHRDVPWTSEQAHQADHRVEERPAD